MITLERNKTIRRELLRRMLSGVEKHFANQTFVLSGRTYSTDDLTRAIQADIDAIDATTKAYTTWLALIEAERQSHQAFAPIARAVRSMVMATFGDTVDIGGVLGDFGFKARKVSEKTPATLVEAAAKARATRKARHTMGSRQKLAITGSSEPGETPGEKPTEP